MWIVLALYPSCQIGFNTNRSKTHWAPCILVFQLQVLIPYWELYYQFRGCSRPNIANIGISEFLGIVFLKFYYLNYFISMKCVYCCELSVCFYKLCLILIYNFIPLYFHPHLNSVQHSHISCQMYIINLIAKLSSSWQVQLNLSWR